jgi:hypothetical protein
MVQLLSSYLPSHLEKDGGRKERKKEGRERRKEGRKGKKRSIPPKGGISIFTLLWLYPWP